MVISLLFIVADEVSNPSCSVGQANLMRGIRTLKRCGKRIFPRRRGDRSELASDARGAEPLWKFAEQIWVLGRRPESLLLRFLVLHTMQVRRANFENGFEPEGLWGRIRRI